MGDIVPEAHIICLVVADGGVRSLAADGRVRTDDGAWCIEYGRLRLDGQVGFDDGEM